MMRQVGRTFGSLLGGYATMILLIFLAQEVLFGGVSYYDTPLPQLLIAGLLTSLSALIGGAVATLLNGRESFLPVYFICGLVIAETTYMIASGRLEGPHWFDVLASSSLLAGLVVGAMLVRRRSSVDVSQPSAS